jgi:hypothetical protein
MQPAAELEGRVGLQHCLTRRLRPLRRLLLLRHIQASQGMPEVNHTHRWSGSDTSGTAWHILYMKSP